VFGAARAAEAQTATITGTVRNVSGTALANITVNVLAPVDLSVAGTATTNASGVYTATVAPGSYKVLTTNGATQGVVDQLHNTPTSVPCPGGTCSVGTNGVLVFAPSGSTSTVNFTLTPISALITGTVRNAAATPLANITVTVVTPTGGSVAGGTATTNASGVYTATVAPGSYKVLTTNGATQGVVDQLHNTPTSVPCPGGTCSIGTNGVLVTADGVTAATVNFTLPPTTAVITGTVRNAANTPLSNISVVLMTSSGATVTGGTTTTNASGVYTFNVAAGTYKVRTSTGRDQNYVDQLYNGVACPNSSCSISTLGTTVTGVVGTMVTNINFTLQTGTRVIGTITNSVTSAPIQGVGVRVDNASGTPVGFGFTNASGVYTAAGIPAGTYYVKTYNALGFVDKAFDNVSCYVCSASSSGAAVPLVIGTDRTINFALTPGGRISGTVTDSNNQPLANIRLRVYDTTGAQLAEATSAANGTYKLPRDDGDFFGSLPPGTYYMRTANSLGYIEQTHNGVNAPLPAITTAPPLIITAGATTPINFSLIKGGLISGRLVDSAGVGVVGMPIRVINGTNPAAPVVVNDLTSGTDGAFTTVGLHAGTYFVRTNTSTANLVDQIWEGKPWANASDLTVVAIGTPVPVTLGATTTLPRNIVMPPGGRVGGRVTDAAGAPLSGVTVTVSNAAGTSLAASVTGADGAWGVRNLANGTVFARTSNTAGYLNKVYNGLQCVTCTATNAAAGTPITAVQGSLITGIDFSLARGGQIAGTVTNASTSAGVSGVAIVFYTPQGQQAATATSTTGGAYLSPGLPPGTYTALIPAASGLVPELYDNITCLSCFGAAAVNGAKITVTAGATTSGINFALDPSGTITGTVRNSANAPVASVSIAVVNRQNVVVSNGVTNAQGAYSATGLPSGTYFVRTNLSATAPYLGQVYASPSNLVCESCNAAELGSAVTVTAPATVSNINFTLAAAGGISGTVRDSSQAGIPNVTMLLANSAGTFVKDVLTNAQGVYTFSGLATGQYYVRTNTGQYVNQVYSGVVCANCSILTGTPITVTAGATTTGRDFELSTGGRINGVVTAAAGGPIEGVTISVATGTGVTAGVAVTNAAGAYQVAGLTPGTYFAKASNTLGYINEVFDNLTCANCSGLGGTPIVVTATTPATASFVLVPGGGIAGTVTVRDDGLPLSGARVSIFNSANQPVTEMLTNDAGVWSTGVGLPVGRYYASFSAAGYVPKAYNNITCVSCPINSTTQIVVAAGAITSGIDAALAEGGRLAGRITDTNNAPVEGVLVTVFDKKSGTPVGSATSGANGNYAVLGLPSGTVTARTSNMLGYIDELFDDTACATCSPTTGKSIAVVAGATTADVNFSLVRGGRIGGLISAQGGGPLAAVTVSIYDPLNRLVATTMTNPIGAYITSGLPAGRYFVKTTNNALGYVNQVYLAKPCGSCAPNTGTPVDVVGTETTGSINFALELGGTIIGTVRNAANEPLANINVHVTGPTGIQFSATTTSASGTYRLTGLPTGQYWARTSNADGFLDRVYNDVECMTCGSLTGTPITARAGEVTPGIDFRLGVGASIAGTVTDAAGAPLANIVVRVHTPGGTAMTSATTDARGRYQTTRGLVAGTYYVSTFNLVGLIDKVYNNVECVNCLITRGQPVVLAAGAPTTGIDFSLSSGTEITGAITASSGGAIEGVTVSVLRANGTVVTTGETNAAGEYRTGTVPAGTYFVRTRNTAGYTDQIYSGRDCINCSPSLGTPVTASGSGEVSGINFSLVFGGRVSGVVRASTGATSGVPIAGATVRIYTPAGVEVASGISDATGAYTAAAGLETGTYYAAVDAGDGYVDGIFGLRACSTCRVTSGTPISVVAGMTTSGINFDLQSGGLISGRVTDSASGDGLVGATVDVYSRQGDLLERVTTGDAGSWVTTQALSPGDYRAIARSAVGHLSQAWNNVTCGTCTALRGTPILVAQGLGGSVTNASNINFALTLGGTVSGVVTDAGNGAPISGVGVDIYDSANNVVNSSVTDDAGRYVSEGGLPVGTYFVRTRNELGYINLLHPAIQCLVCTPNKGTGVVVGAGANVIGINFALQAGGRISGTVRSEREHTPLAGVTVKVYDQRAALVATAVSDAAGEYLTDVGLISGQYTLITSNTLGYTDLLYQQGQCPWCDPRSGSPVTVSLGQTLPGIDFLLSRGITITGVVTAADTGLPLGNVDVEIWSNLSGARIKTVTTDASGRYTASGLAVAAYNLRTLNVMGYVDQGLGGVTCGLGCVFRSTAVRVFPSGVATGKDFSLERGGLFSGYAYDNRTSAPLVGVQVYAILRRADGAQEPFALVTTDSRGYYAMSLPVGNYSLMTVGNGYVKPSAVSRDGLSSDTGTITVRLGEETDNVAIGLAACTPPEFNIHSLLNGRVAVVYADTVTATGGTGALRFSVASGTLTPGLSLDAATGRITGTPTASGTALITVGVTDASSCEATQEFFLTTADAFPVATLSPAALRFAATKAGSSGALTSVTAPQTLSVLFDTGAPAWTVTSSEPWLVLSASAGRGSSALSASVVNTNNVLGALTSATATITLTSTGTQNTVITLPVTLTINQNPSSTVKPFGQVDTPLQNTADVVGAIGITGWALDDVGVDSVDIYRACLAIDSPASCQMILGHRVVFLGEAVFLAGARPDVEATYPGYPEGHLAGWGLQILTNQLPHVPNAQLSGGQGPLTLYAFATDVAGNISLLGRSANPADPGFAAPTSITLANDGIAKPFGAIDTPTQGATVSGVLNNFGWALTPDSNTTAGSGDILIPTNGSTMTVFIDGLPVGLVTYNQCRGSVGNPVPTGLFCNDDVANIFGATTPQAVLTSRTGNATLFRNLDANRGAIGAFTINTATLTNGLHTIAWSVTDSAGRTEGIGSRFFNVLNAGADQDIVLRAQPAITRGHALSLAGRPAAAGGVWFRTGFDVMQTWSDLPLNEQGSRHIAVTEAERVDLWMGGPVDAGHLIVNGTLRDLPVGASLKGAQFAWAPPVGYIGTYHLVFLRSGERVDVFVTIGPTPGGGIGTDGGLHR
jgi:hypothetical protein